MTAATGATLPVTANRAMTLPPVIVVKHDDAALQLVERISAEAELAIGNPNLSSFRKAIVLATGMKALKNALTPAIMNDVAELMNSQLGFRTDRDPNASWQPKEAYSVEVVKECFIEAVLRGAKPIGNEFNIIAARTYLTKEFFQRAVGQLPDITDVEVSPGLPQMPPGDGGGEARIRMAVKWKRSGHPQELISNDGTAGRLFSIRTNKGMGIDAVIGKATRKALKAAYEKITGSEMLPDGDLDDAITPPAAADNASIMNDRARQATPVPSAGAPAAAGGAPKPQTTPATPKPATGPAGAQPKTTAAPGGAPVSKKEFPDEPPMGTLKGDPGYVDKSTGEEHPEGIAGTDAGAASQAETSKPAGEAAPAAGAQQQAAGTTPNKTEATIPPKSATAPKAVAGAGEALPDTMPMSAPMTWIVGYVAAKYNIVPTDAGNWLRLKMSKPWEKMDEESKQDFFLSIQTGVRNYPN